MVITESPTQPVLRPATQGARKLRGMVWLFHLLFAKHNRFSLRNATTLLLPGTSSQGEADFIGLCVRHP